MMFPIKNCLGILSSGVFHFKLSPKSQNSELKTPNKLTLRTCKTRMKDLLLQGSPFSSTYGTTHFRTRQPSIVLRHFTFQTLECLDFHAENTSTYKSHVFRKINVIKLSFKAMFLLWYKISSDPITKQFPRKATNFLHSTPRILLH